MLLKTKLVFLFLFIVWVAAPVAANPGSWRYWKEGEVTRKTWTEEGGFRKIGIDEIPYTMMPDSRIYRVTKSYDGVFNEVPVSLESVSRSQRVEFLVQGFRIYQIKILP